MDRKNQTILHSVKIISIFVLVTLTTQLLAFDMKHLLANGHAVIQLGGYWSIQGQGQQVNIQGLIGDRFTVKKNQSSNGLIGLGYYIDGQEKPLYKMTYGINAFYLGKTSVSGDVIQEDLFTNLSYGYTVSHFPVYAIAKSIFNIKSSPYALTVDIGIGPNFLTAGNFQEHSLDGGLTIPDNIFSGHTATAFSATVGAGIRLNNAFAPLECGYRFFYLGQGNFNATSSQVLNNLNTGSDYANAIICSVII